MLVSSGRETPHGPASGSITVTLSDERSRARRPQGGKQDWHRAPPQRRRGLGPPARALTAPLAAAALACQMACQGEPSWEGPTPAAAARPSAGLTVSAGRLSWNGAPLVLTGESATQAWAETGGDFDDRAWIDALASRGLNATLVWSYIASSAQRRVADARIGYDAPTLWPWCGSVTAGDIDLGCFDERYFRRLQELVAYAESRRVVVVVTVHDGWAKGRFGEHPFNSSVGNGPLRRGAEYVELAHYGREMPAELDPRWSRIERNQYFQERFCARLIEALQGHENVIYELFNEGEWFDPARRLLHEQHFLEFFRARTRALLASNVDHIVAGDPAGDPRVDVISVHRPRWNQRTSARDSFSHFADWRRREPEKPVLFSETVPAWSGLPDELDPLMRLSWGSLLGGGHVLIQDDVAFRFAERSGMDEHAADHERLLDRLGNAARFAADVDLTTMRPEPNLCSTRVCMAGPRGAYLVYAQTADELWVDLSDVDAERVEASWHDPRTGTSTAPETATPAERTYFDPPFADAILHVRRVP